MLGISELPEFNDVLDAIAGGSPFVSDGLLKDPELLWTIHNQGIAETWRKILAELAASPIDERKSLMAQMRKIRQQAALVIAWADLTAQWDLEELTAGLSEFAISATAISADHLLSEAGRRGEIELADPENPSRNSGIVILAMGKMGALELNYSSDIDLIVLFDPERLSYRGPESPMAFAVRFARSLSYILEQRTKDGYVARVDLRLRPHLPGHPLAISTDDAELYYERHGQNWERAAFIKARAVAGDVDAGELFLQQMQPFIWRKHLDYAAIRDIHAIKRQINAFRGFGDIKVWGHDLKVGGGGIREIEFFAQTQQLILGGQNRGIRNSGTVAALEALAEARWVDRQVIDELVHAYRYLRFLEHRLQMRQDQQTQRMPQSDRDCAQFAAFAGYASAEALEKELRSVLSTVGEHYAALFEGEADLGEGGSLEFTGIQTSPETIATLEALGFRDPEKIAARVRAWHHGHVRATRSTRARELLTELMPSILRALQRQPNIDEAFQLFDEFLTNLPMGVQLFSLIRAHPGLLRLLTDLFGAIPRLARYLSAHTDLFEAMLSPDFFEPLPDRAELEAELANRLRDARDLQDVMDMTRRWAHGRQFQAGLHVVRGTSSADEATSMLTELAEMVLELMLRRSREWLEEEHGRIENSQFVILGLGKLGSRELTIGSDLDLVFVYDAPEDARSDGPKPLKAQSYFARLGQRLIAAISSQTSEGRLFEIDTRLRPSGNVGPVACSLENFESYNRDTAQTWELQALTRARRVAGDNELGDRLATVIDAILCQERPIEALRTQVRTMRERVFKEHGSDDHWNLKHTRGGLVGLEFLAQFLQLAHACNHRELRTSSTREVLKRAGETGLIAPEEARALSEVLRLQIALQLVLRLSNIEKLDEAETADGLKETLVRAASRQIGGDALIPNFTSLRRRLVESQALARQVFERECPVPPET